VALTRAIGITGTTVTAAGVILAGAFVVLGFAGGSSQTEELGFSIAFSVLLDTLFVRTLLLPSIAMLLGRWNRWPAPLSRPVPSGPEAQRAPCPHLDRLSAAWARFVSGHAWHPPWHNRCPGAWWGSSLKRRWR
jgi:multidrug efflux pump subunit AcrB